ncbi:4840_t:CDS:2, partial [Rhizophagus irregularis]
STTISSETSTANSQTVDIINESMIELEKRANETIKRLLPSKDLEEIWKAIELRIIDLTNWPSLEWSRILKTEDKAKLFRTCWQKLLKDQIDETVIHLIDETSLRNLNDLKQLKDKLSNIGSEDGNLSAEIISFFHKCYRRKEYDSGRFQTY